MKLLIQRTMYIVLEFFIETETYTRYYRDLKSLKEPQMS